ncbi:MAG TPA: patatin-like phospholipase family protein [Rubrivivax sp.]|nr:patatin-like phospholipase family protein [Rubrivivax sp.]
MFSTLNGSIRLGLAMVFVLQALAVDAQGLDAGATAPAASRPRICLVLSGGGARGAAHVGVLKVLEDLRVPVHCIAGTSMGAIVGASYASGMGTDEMLAEMAQITSERLFNDKPPRADQPMRIKAEDTLPLAAPELGLNDGKLSLPKGLINGVALEAELRRLVRVRDARRFDQLPIPFRAVATSLGDGQMVVFDRGLLPTAMRASMAVPGLIAPLKLGDRLLIDGGLVRNLPVDVAREMGADVIIAVNLGTPLLRPDQIDGLQGVSMQTLGILTEQNVRQSLQQLRPQDVLIEPALGDFSAADFDNLIKAVPFGQAAALQAAPRLRALAVPAPEFAQLRRQQQSGEAPALPVIAAVEIAGQRRVNAESIVQTMQTQAGQPLDQDVLDLDMRRIYGSGDFESVRPELLDAGGTQTLVVNVTEKGWGPQYLRLGLSLSSDLGQDAQFNFYGQLRSTWLNSLGAEWRNDVVLGNDVVLASRFYQPLSPSQRWFVEPRVAYSDTPLYLYSGDVLAALYREHTLGAGLDAGLNFSHYGQLRLGVYRGNSELELSSGQLFLPKSLEVDLGLVQASLRIDQLDSASFARSGYLLALNALVSRSQLGASQDYDRYDAEVRAAFSHDAHTLRLALRGGGSIGDDPLPVYAMFRLGGFLNMSGFRLQQLLGTRFVYGRALYQARLGSVPLFEGVYAGLAYEIADMPQTVALNNRSSFQSGTAYLAADTPLGAAYFGVGYANQGTAAVYLYLGRPF